jgi:hypothetical protein
MTVEAATPVQLDVGAVRLRRRRAANPLILTENQRAGVRLFIFQRKSSIKVT